MSSPLKISPLPASPGVPGECQEPGAGTNPEWFREPTPREHRIAAALFLGFGIFFVLLFKVLVGWWFRWVILFLAIISVLYALNHVRDLRRQR